MVCGSVRRNRETCGDGDIVFWEKDRDAISKIMLDAKEKNLILKMETMQSGKVNNVTMNTGFKIDLWFAAENGWWHKVQFYTGSHDYNETIIAKINPTGKRIGRTGFFDELGQRIIVNSEEELFRVYGIDYIPPEDRSLIL